MKTFIGSLIFVTAFLFSGCPAPKEVKAGLGAIDGDIITEEQARKEGAEELEALELKRLQNEASFKRDERKILEQAVERIIEEKLIGKEAEARGISSEELIEAEVSQKVQEPSDAEIETFYEANKNRISMSREEVLPQIKDYLKRNEEKRLREDFLARLEKEHAIVRNLDPMKFDVDAAGRPFKGPASAPVVLVEFSDFQCPYCRSFSATLKQVMEKYDGKVRLVFRQFPLANIHKDAERAAEASLCAADQNRFWDLHDYFFENQGKMGDEDILNQVEKLGLDREAFRSCLVAGKSESRVREDIRAGAAAGVEGTPTLFINGRYFSGNYPYEQVAAIIDEELKTAKVQ
jgi:protein-disulfide isomerase